MSTVCDRVKPFRTFRQTLTALLFRDAADNRMVAQIHPVESVTIGRDLIRRCIRITRLAYTFHPCAKR